MEQEWRVSIALDAVPRAERRLGSLRPALSARLGDQADISVGSDRIFVYTSTAEEATAIAQAARDVLAQHGIASPEWVRAEVWLPTHERWGGAADVTPARIARAYENAQTYRQAKERENSAVRGIPGWRVTVTVRSGREAKAVREYLTAAGWPMRAGRRRLVAWANCEDDAKALATALTGAGLIGVRGRIEVGRQAYLESKSSGISLMDFLPP